MLPAARPVPPPEPVTLPGPDRLVLDPRPTRRLRRMVLILGTIAALAAMLFPFAPVQQPQVTYTWPSAPGDPTPAAVPLMPYQPVELVATVDCAAAVAAGDERTLLSTLPLQVDPTAEPLDGLSVVVRGDALHVSSAGMALGSVPLPADIPTETCSVRLWSTPERTVVFLDDQEVLTRPGDVRPAVAGVFTEVADATGLHVQVITDTRFQTTITPLKAGIGAVALIALAGMLVAVRRLDGPARIQLATSPTRRRWRPRAVDTVVIALLGVWWIVGGITVDDGYITGIVRSRASNGFIGNVYRWLNAPEAPFSWFYDLYWAWSQVSSSTVWMRLPSTLLGLLCWVLLSRFVLPRLGRVATRPSTPWLAGLAFATWWIPFNLGLRPEPWVATGLLGVFLLVEQAIATRRLFPLATGLVVAGATTAVTPAGLMAFTPFVAAAVPVARLLRVRRDLSRAALIAMLVAAPASALLLMAADQSLAAIREATRVRTLIGGGLPWYQEYERYQLLLTPEDIQGAIGRRAAVLCTVFAALLVLRAISRHWAPGVATGPARRLAVGLLLALVAMMLSPTKWTQHFGDVAGIGTAVLLLGLVCAGPAVRRAPARSGVVIVAVTGLVSAVVLAGYNVWPYASNWFPPTWSTVVPHVSGVPVATIALGVTCLVVLVLAGWTVRARVRETSVVRLPRWVPNPAVAVATVLIAVLGLQVLSFVRVSIEHRDSYTLATDAIRTIRGESCGLAQDVFVETDPAAGVLPPVPDAPPEPPREPPLEAAVDLGGAVLPAVAVSGNTSTAWLALEEDQRTRALPVVVSVAGTVRPADAVTVEFGRAGTVIERVALINRDDSAGEPGVTDHRILAPDGADSVRLTVAAAPTGPADRPAAVALPRAPRLTPMLELLPPGSTAILDWPVAFLFPCHAPEPLPLGTAGLAGWRVGPPADDPAARITYSPTYGGPYVTPRLLVTEHRMPAYLRGDPTRDPIQLYRWTSVTELRQVEPVVDWRMVPGWDARGRTRVPGLDPVG